jgi:hypothetical protein
LSSKGNLVQKWKQRLNLLLHSQLVLLYISGFKRLFYHQDEDESKRKLSILKILILFLYLCAFVLSFLQFAEGNIPSAVREEWSIKENVELLEMFPLSIYGILAFTFVSIICTSIFYFAFTRDRPIINTFNSVKAYAAGSKKNLRAIIVILSLFLIILVWQVVQSILFPETFENFVISISYRAGIGILLAWVVLQPLLVFTGLLLTFDTIAKDYPRPFQGYNKFNISIFVLTILFVIGIAGVISIIFGINFTDGIGEGSPYVALKNYPNIFYSLYGIYFMLIGIMTISVIIIILVLIEIFLKYKKGKNEIQERRKANFMLIFPFLIIYVILKAAPFAFAFSFNLRSLNNLIDILSLVTVMFFAIFRVLAVKDSLNQVELNHRILRRPKQWLDLIPTYSKVLIILYLVFVSFYAGLEANTIFTISGGISQFEEIQMDASIGISFLILLYVFWRYKPENQLTTNNK